MRASLSDSSRFERRCERSLIRPPEWRASQQLSQLFAVLFALATVISVPCVSFADRWYEDFERAVELIGDGNCSREALQLLGAAVVDKPRPRLNARTIAVQSIDYLPYYQLARAHLACGDSDSTRYYLDISREKGVAPANLLNDLEQQLAMLKVRVETDIEPVVDSEDLARQVKAVTETIRRARLLAGQVASRKVDRRFAQFFQDNSSLLESASAELRNAEEQLNEGTLNRDLEAIDAASETATGAVRAYTDIAEQIALLEAITPTATPVVAQPSPTATAIPLRPSPTAVMARPTQRPTAIVPNLTAPPRQPSTREVPASLRLAAAEYLRGEYDDVVNLLDPDKFSGEREQAAAYLLRAAAQFSVYCLDGRQDEKRLIEIRRNLAQFVELRPELQPDSRFFSPEFVQLFRGAR